MSREHGLTTLLERSVVSADNGEVQRLRGEVRALRGIADAGALAAALDLIDQAVGQTSRAGLQVLTERLARAAARAAARLHRSDRRAARRVLRAAAGSEDEA